MEREASLRDGGSGGGGAAVATAMAAASSSRRRPSRRNDVEEIGRPGRGRRGGHRRSVGSRDLDSHVRSTGKDANAESFSRDFVEELIPAPKIRDGFVSNEQADAAETNEHVIADAVEILRDDSGKANEDDSSAVYPELNGNEHLPDEESSIQAELSEMRTQMVLYRERELSMLDKLDTVRQRNHMQKEESLRADYEAELRGKDDEIERYRARLQSVEKSFQDLCTVLERKDAESAQREGELTRRLEECRVRESQSSQIIQNLQGQMERMREQLQSQVFSANPTVYNPPGFHSSENSYINRWTPNSSSQHKNGEVLASDMIPYQWEHEPRSEQGSDTKTRTSLSINALSEHYNPPFSQRQQDNVLGHQNSNFGSDISRLFGSKATRNSNPIDDFRYSYASDADAGTQFQSRGEHQWDSDNQASELLQAGNHVVFGKKDIPTNSVGNGVPNVDVPRHNGALDEAINSQSHGEATSVFVTPLAQSQN